MQLKDNCRAAKTINKVVFSFYGVAT